MQSLLNPYEFYGHKRAVEFLKKRGYSVRTVTVEITSAVYHNRIMTEPTDFLCVFVGSEMISPENKNLIVGHFTRFHYVEETFNKIFMEELIDSLDKLVEQ